MWLIKLISSAIEKIMFRLLDSMGLRLVSFEETEAGMNAEIRCADGSEYEVRVSEKSRRKENEN